MPSEQSEILTDNQDCAGARANLKRCVLESDCCKKDKKTPRECLLSNLVPEECKLLRNSFFECKRSILHNRMRFGGRRGY